ncbi:MAG: ABC transporter ATP-binding protein [Thermoprotei archaeon]|nr:MAG: ABC transporter ATP-binding protein [Thermoprotei archaeon]
MELLRVEDLHVYYKSVWGLYRVVDGVTLSVKSKEIFGIAGESGCGKSTLVEGILRLIKPPGFIAKGRVIFKGIDLLKLDEEELRRLRWKELSYIPQGSMNSLNPVMRVEDQMVDVVLEHSNISEEEARKLVREYLKRVGLPPEVARMYPHELSGGMKQRVIIAMAMLLRPSLVIADEPVTALDVVIQRVILQLLKDLRDEYGATVIYVAHDLATHAELVDRMAIMYAGKIIEIGSVEEIFLEPLHPYSKLLISSVPTPERRVIRGIPGVAPSPLKWPPGCRFHPRCPEAMPICSRKEPKPVDLGGGRMVACHLYGGE